MKKTFQLSLCVVALLAGLSCGSGHREKHADEKTNQKEVTAKDILGNPEYQAICYEGYRQKSRAVQPTPDQLKEDLRILSAMGIRILRTYNVQLPHASNLLRVIQEMKQDEPGFEMYVMLGAWIDCKNAWTEQPVDHDVESEQNEGEIDRAVALANQYPDIVKVLAVGNEAMVKWATSYYVQPSVILKWVNHLQSLKAAGKLPKSLWITSSDDFASWGGGDPGYHTEDLARLIKAVDYISMHTYPYHNTHYNPEFWLVPREEMSLPEIQQIDSAMRRARDFAVSQYLAVRNHMKSLGVEKPIHIGETGWATISDGFYGPDGSRATDEYKQGLYYKHIRDWANASGLSCFYFEAFNEQWKDAANPQGSENHFGVFGLQGEAKYAMWDLVDRGLFKNLTRDGHPMVKTYDGNIQKLLRDVKAPPASSKPSVKH